MKIKKKVKKVSKKKIIIFSKEISKFIINSKIIIKINNLKFICLKKYINY